MDVPVQRPLAELQQALVAEPLKAVAAVQRLQPCSQRAHDAQASSRYIGRGHIDKGDPHAGGQDGSDTVVIGRSSRVGKVAEPNWIARLFVQEVSSAATVRRRVEERVL